VGLVYGRTKNTSNFGWKTSGKNHLGDQSTNGRIILKINLRETGCENVDGTSGRHRGVATFFNIL
jgi:hypothetical protein